MAIAEITPQFLDVKVSGASSGVVVPAPRTSSEAIAPNRSHFGDRLLAGLLLLALLPVFLVIALLIKVGSRGPVFFSQDRVGLHGQLFPFFKFRTMIPGADAMRDEALGTPDEDMTDQYRSDPRITRVGHFLRRWSLDELPQLLNVARGEMAIVGPRPMLPREVALLERPHHRRHDATPGLTGLWQVSGRKETTWTERMELDLRYVDEQSARFDLDIIRRTVSVVLRGEGAY